MTYQNQSEVEFGRFGIFWIINPLGKDPENMLTVNCQLFRDENPLDSHWFQPEGDHPSKDNPLIYPFNLDLEKFVPSPRPAGKPPQILYYANGQLNFWYDADSKPALTIDLTYGPPDDVKQLSDYVLIELNSSSGSSSSASSDGPISFSSSEVSSSSDSSTISSSSSSSLASSSSSSSSSSDSSEGLSSSSSSPESSGSSTPGPRRRARKRG